MSNLLDRFQKHIIGSDGKFADYTSTISPKGDFKRISDLEVILNSWKNILITPLRTVDHDPDYGSELYKYVFHQADEDTVEAVKNEVEYRLMSIDSRATITNIVVEFFRNMKGIAITVECEYEGETGEVKTVIDPRNLNFLE